MQIKGESRQLGKNNRKAVSAEVTFYHHRFSLSVGETTRSFSSSRAPYKLVGRVWVMLSLRENSTLD